MTQQDPNSPHRPRSISSPLNSPSTPPPPLPPNGRPGEDEDDPLLMAEPLEDEKDQEEEPIQLVDMGGEQVDSGIRAFGAAAGGLGQKQRKAYDRTPNVTGEGAVRCRLFHSKLHAGSLEHMEEQINDWIDDEAIEVKHVGHVVGTMEGKRAEPNLIVMVWY